MDEGNIHIIVDMMIYMLLKKTREIKWLYTEPCLEPFKKGIRLGPPNFVEILGPQIIKKILLHGS